MTTSGFAQAPSWKEELVHTDSAQVHTNYCDGGDGDGDGDGDDALSLCDLPLYCDAADHSFADDDDASTSSSSSSCSSSSSDHDDFFEFSSIGGSESSSDLGSDDRSIVFCGKLISRRESPPPPTPPTTPEKKRSPLPAGRGSRESTSRRTRSPAVRRRKCRWYLMAFGLARFPTEMAMSEMRTRQSRNVEKMGSCDGGGDCGGKGKGKGLFGLLKALGLGHRRRADALVKASLGCVPRV